MDKIDLNILALLERDASIKNWELAEKVALAPSSCLRRVNRLKESGAIRRIVALTDPALSGEAVRANILVYLSDHNTSASRSLITRLQRDKAVKELQSISGQADLFISAAVATLDDMKSFCDRFFANDPLVARYETMFVFRDHLD